MSVQSFPLSWPPGVPRSKHRESGRLKASFDTSLANVVKSLNGFGSDSGKKITDAVLSSNMSLLDKYPTDPGVAVWFTWDGMSVAIPIDRYDTPAKNLQAVHHILESRRTELRHGTLHLVRATFQGFKALPAPAGKHWRDILGLKDIDINRLDKSDIERAYRERATYAHPDKRGGSDNAMAELNAARDTALAEVVG